MNSDKYGLKKYQPAMANCPYCKALLRPERLAKHIRKKHPNVAGQRTPEQPINPPVKREKPRKRPIINHNLVAACPHCGQVMQERFLEGHLRLHEQASKHPVHIEPVVRPQEEPPEALANKEPSKAAPAAEKGQKKRRGGSSGGGAGNGGAWYRDGAGDLWFGSHDERNLHIHIVDTGPVMPTRKNNQPEKPAGAGAQNLPQQHQSKSREAWVRDSDGDLWLGNPPAGQKPNPDLEDYATKRPQNSKKTKPAPKKPHTRRMDIASTIKSKDGPMTICPICSRLAAKANLDVHLLEHPGISVCRVCGQIVQELNLAHHMTRHPDWCPVCDNKIGGEVLQHLRRAHHLTLQVSLEGLYEKVRNNLPIFTCNYCHQVISLKEYSNHQQPHQPAPAPASPGTSAPKKGTQKNLSNNTRQTVRVPCPVCRKGIQEVKLQAHLSDKHPACPYCQKRCSGSSSLKAHIERRHPGKSIPKS